MIIYEIVVWKPTGLYLWDHLTLILPITVLNTEYFIIINHYYNDQQHTGHSKTMIILQTSSLRKISYCHIQ